MILEFGVEQLHVRPEAFVVAVGEHVVAGGAEHEVGGVVAHVVVYLAYGKLYRLELVVELGYLRVGGVYALHELDALLSFIHVGSQVF